MNTLSSIVMHSSDTFDIRIAVFETVADLDLMLQKFPVPALVATD